MPWRKYTPKQAKFGLSYHVVKGVVVRQDRRGKWGVFFEKRGQRRNITFGCGRAALVAAIKAAEAAAAAFGSEHVPFAAASGPRRAPLAAAQQAAQHVPVAPEAVKTADGRAHALEKDELPSFKSLAAQWVENGLIRWSEATVERYYGLLERYIKASDFFDSPVDLIKRSQIRSFLLALSRQKSPATIETVHGVISGVFSEAIEQELINANPAAALLKTILPPLAQRDLKPADPFCRAELSRFLDHSQSLGSPAEQLVLKVMAFGGFRLGEALALKAEYLNAQQRTYYICQSFGRGKLSRPKHGKSRLVDLPDFLVGCATRTICATLTHRFC
jgi:hypothetical protein